MVRRTRQPTSSVEPVRRSRARPRGAAADPPPLLDELAAATRPREAFADCLRDALRVIGWHLQASRCVYAHVDDDRDQFTIPHDYTDSCKSTVGRYRLSLLGPHAVAELRQGNTLVVRDVHADAAFGDSADMCNAFEIKALICCPFVRAGKLRAIIAVHQSAARDWSAAEIALLETAAERCWAMIEVRAVEEELRLRERQLQAVVDTSPESIVLLSPDGTILEINASGLAMNGAANEAVLVGTKFEKLVAEEDRAHFREFHRAVCKGHGGRISFDLAGANDARRTVETLSAAVKGADGRLQHLAISRDVGEATRLQEQLRQAQKMESVGQLAGGVAHDFNNLLMVVIGYCDILGERKTLPEAEQELVDEVRRAGERAAALTRQLLAFSRRQILEPKVLNLNTIVTDLQRMLRRLIGEDIELTCNLHGALWPVKVDAGQVDQVIVNLAVNARDAMPNGGQLVIETNNVEWTGEEPGRRSRLDRPSGRFAALSVRDSGTGMPADVQERIFEPFFTTKQSGKGTGLGLSVVERIVKQSDGFLDVRSELGAGTTLTAYFPAARAAASATHDHASAPVALRGTEAVLLVEDQDDVRKLLRLALEAQGYEVHEASNGKAALALAALAAPIDIVVTDVIMPTMSGRELVERLRMTSPDLKALFVTGYTDDALMPHVGADGQHGFLQKPFAPLALAAKIREMLDDVKHSRHILFVDDEAPLVLLATRMLEEHGYRVSGCANGLDAIAAFMRDPLDFDIVVTDLNMRGMSGLELAKQLRAFRPELPVLVASGYVDDDLEKKAAEAGVSELLYKPGTIEEFGLLIHRTAAKLAPG
jgi:PAS domain S-box-containing protein